MSERSGDRIGAGIGLGVIAYSLFAMHDASNKWLVATLPVAEVLFARSLTITLACLVIGRGPLLTRALATPLKRSLMLRSVLTLAAWLCYYTASRSLAAGADDDALFQRAADHHDAGDPDARRTHRPAALDRRRNRFPRRAGGKRPARFARLLRHRAGAGGRGDVGHRHRADAPDLPPRILHPADALSERVFS